MGSSLSPIIANIFLKYFEQSLLAQCPSDFKPNFYKRYLDDTFLLFNSREKAQQFLTYAKSRHENIKFTFEGERNNSLSFLDVTVSRDNDRFLTTVFRKKTFTGQGLNYFSNIYDKYKLSCIYTLLHRAFELSSSYQAFHNEVIFLTKYFKDNYYPTKIINRMIKSFLNRKYVCRQELYSVPKLKLYIKLPFIGKQTLNLIKELKLLLGKYYPQTQPCFYFRDSYTIGNILCKKERSDSMLRSGVVYKYTCDNCQLSYIGSTVLQLYRRCAQHAGVSFRTNKPLTKPDHSTIRQHCNSNNHAFNNRNFSILSSDSNSHNLRILESLYISTYKPTLNSYLSSVPLNMYNS